MRGGLIKAGSVDVSIGWGNLLEGIKLEISGDSRAVSGAKTKTVA
jgi:hypothetical protein